MYETQQSSSKREIYSKTDLHQETRKISSKQSYFAPKRIRETTSQQRKETVKIWAEINEIENQKNTRTENIVKTKTCFFGNKNKIDNLTRLTKKIRKRAQINKTKIKKYNKIKLKIKGGKLQQTQLK